MKNDFLFDLEDTTIKAENMAHKGWHFFVLNKDGKWVFSDVVFSNRTPTKNQLIKKYINKQNLAQPFIVENKQQGV